MAPHSDMRAAAIETLRTPPPVSQLASPLDFLFGEHFRQRVLCGTLDRIAEEKGGAEGEIAVVLGFLARDFSSHMLDEEEDLFPMLRRRAHPADRIGDVLDELSEEHAFDRLDAAAIVEALAPVGRSQAAVSPTPDNCHLFRRFAANERRHLITENAIVLPLARALLKPRDLEELGRRMAARRGWAYPGEADEA